MNALLIFILASFKSIQKLIYLSIYLYVYNGRDDQKDQANTFGEGEWNHCSIIRENLKLQKQLCYFSPFLLLAIFEPGFDFRTLIGVLTDHINACPHCSTLTN